MDKAREYKADAVFFEASRSGRPPVPQAFIYKRGGPTDEHFAVLHKRLWSWGGVPLVYRVSPGMVHLFRCAHKPDFIHGKAGDSKPHKILNAAARIANDPWWDADRLRNGTLWDDPAVCRDLLSRDDAAQKSLIQAVKDLHKDLDGLLRWEVRRRLLILSIMIAYLEARDVFEEGYFGQFKRGAHRFFDVLADGKALLKLLADLERRFNGNVFALSEADRDALSTSTRLGQFAQKLDGRSDTGGQLRIWDKYSFADLPVELMSHIYQLFVTDKTEAVYTPHFVVRLMVGEALSWDRIDRLHEKDEVVLDGACGSGVFLVEAYKRLILHWRSKNDWKNPTIKVLQRLLTTRIRGIDLEGGAAELAAFSLYLALCDALHPTAIRQSEKLFPLLMDRTILEGCFFEACSEGKIVGKVGVVLGNPPFKSKLTTDGAVAAYGLYAAEHDHKIPDQQLALLFLHVSMQLLTQGGVLSMIQPNSFLYNDLSLKFRRSFIEHWDLREILDMISIGGLFLNADPKVLVVVAEKQKPINKRPILHATFRRSGRADSQQGFDIDHYDLHWVRHDVARNNDGIWRSNLLGGGRVLGFVERLRGLRTLGEFAEDQGWDKGEGFIAGGRGVSRPALHVVGKDYLPSQAITLEGIDEDTISVVPEKPIQWPRSERRFTPPMLLVREQMDLPHVLWTKRYLTYSDQIVGFCAPKRQTQELRAIATWLTEERDALRAYIAATSPRLFAQKYTSISQEDITSLPYPESGALILTDQERLIVTDIVYHYRDLILHGARSKMLMHSGLPALNTFNEVFTSQINGVYKKNKLRALETQTWPGIICQPFIFGNSSVDWRDAAALRGKLDKLLRDERSSGLNITRIVRLYDESCIFLIKPDRLRYWLPSIALRDADETLAELAQQGF
ncbi:MAG: SAM-dependent DNA methyltransferase [Flavobacteriales bacterium]|nr:SAM-dependent DNA methyltransferase [Flavobacteriales bacterium]